MPPPGVEFHHVWKRFHRGELHDSLRDLVPAMARRLVGRAPPQDQLRDGDFWALKDVSFEVTPGRALGIIGPNGAGKSTVLKILTRILRPNRGSCVVHGRVGALIEVAAGFHPDLTGRENVFLQGAIMGMSAADTLRKFDEIVEFSGISDFIDTPVKRYSSGMNARLGFAIAAHLDPDVLVIDEVLAVGDYSFQQRAFGRIRELVRRDIPVIVVSHQLDRIAELCTDALLLSRGEVVRQGTAGECIAAYVLNPTLSVVPQASSTDPIILEGLGFDSDAPIRSGDRMRATVRGTVGAAGIPDAIEGLVVTVRSAQTGERLFSSSTRRLGVELPPRGGFELAVELQLNVPPGIYGIEVMVWDRQRGGATGQRVSGYVQVTEGLDFSGPVQMNGSMRVFTLDPARPT
jgi:ABC-type polysaccharide/polyol phosphate transport system ATPase subunit